MTSSSPSALSRLAFPARSASPQTSSAFSGLKNTGCQPSATSAVSCTFFGPSAAMWIGMRSRTGSLMIFSGLPRPVPRSAGKGIWYLFPS